MSGKKISLALIGAGGIGKRYALALAADSTCKLMAIVDADANKAEVLAQQFSGCEAVVDWKNLIRRNDIDAVIVATPHFLLAPISQAFLKAGKHVLSEKPGGVNSAQIERNTRLAKKNRLQYMIGFNHRFHPSFILAKKFVDQKKIGDVMFIRSRYGFGGRKNFNKEWRHNRTIAGGGELIDQGVHMIDLARYFLGDFTSVCGFADSLFWETDVEDNGFVLLRNKKKQTASIHVSWSNWKPIHEFEIYGTKGYIHIIGLGRKYGGTERVILGKRHENDPDHPSEKEFACDPDADTSLARQVQAFARAIGGGKNIIPTGLDGAAVLKIVEKIYGSQKKYEV